MATKATAARRRKPVVCAKDPLFAFTNAQMQPEPAPVPAPDLPSWVTARPSLQPILDYVDRLGQHHRQHVVQIPNIQAQDAECKREIETVLKAGGRQVSLEIIAVNTGTLVSRWNVA